MWICLNNSFLSIVASRDNKNELLVRARRQNDIENVFPNVSTFEDKHADYRYRAFIPKEVVADVIRDYIVNNITYSNFKNSVHDYKLHDAYLDVWQTMYNLQR